MRWFTARAGLIGLSLLLCVALIAKIVRYHEVPERVERNFEADLTRFLGKHDWVSKAPDGEAPNRSGAVREFEKAGCANPLHISVLGETTGLESYLRQKFGDDLAFVQQGVVRDRPSQIQLQIAKTLAAINSFLLRQKTLVTPIFAVIPAPKTTPGPCQGPDHKQWAAFSVNGS